MRISGAWPEAVRLRRGWALGRARPWHDTTPHLAALRIERGGDRFVTSCAAWLWDQGVERVLSPAMPDSQAGIWRRAGFRHHLELVVYERDLARTVEEPVHDVVILDDPALDVLAGIDDRAFDVTWQVGRLGLADAMGATPLAAVLAVREGPDPVGFAIVGEMAGIAYLQRLAVLPEYGGRGIGRSLVRASLRWSLRRGATAMLLNTQPANRVAASLYDSEGFVALGRKLHVLSLARAE